MINNKQNVTPNLGRGDLRRGKWIGEEKFVSGKCESVCDVATEIDTYDGDLDKSDKVRDSSLQLYYCLLYRIKRESGGEI